METGTEIEAVKYDVMRVLWESYQDSVETPFHDLCCGPGLDNLADIADQILAIPAIAQALR